MFGRSRSKGAESFPRARRRCPRTRLTRHQLAAICVCKSARHFAASDAVSYRMPSVACHTHSSAGGSIGRSTRSATIVAPLGGRAFPRRATLPRQTRTWSSPSTAWSVASANQETLTAQSAAWSTHPVGVRCCSIEPRSSITRFNTRSGASSSSSCVTDR